MTENQVPYLCGGVMFFLLVNSVRKDHTPKDSKNGISNEHAEPVIMRDLIYVFTGDKCYGAAKDTSYFKDCVIEGSYNVPFNNIQFVTTFDTTVRTNYSIALERMSEFVFTHFNSSMKEWFVKALLEIIEDDTDIAEDQKFFICEDGSAVSKADLRTMTDFKLQPFLVGILHFILTKRRDKNYLGKGTLDLMGIKKNRKARVYNGKMGEKITRSITVSLREKIAAVEPVPQECDLDEMSDDDVIFENLKGGIELFASLLEAQKHQMAEKIRANKRKNTSEAEYESKMAFVEAELNNNDSGLLQKFRKDCKPVLIYIIENDPSGSATKLSLADEIQDIIQTWQYDVREVKNSGLRKIMFLILKTIENYTEYLSDVYLRYIPDRGVLWFRNESLEEGERLREVLRPKTYELRKQIAELYRKLFPMPEDDEMTAEVADDEEPSGAAEEGKKTTVIQQQTNVIQNGDHNINMTNNGTINFNL